MQTITTNSDTIYHLVEKISETTNTIVWRALKGSQPRVLKILNQDHPSRTEIIKYHNEFSVTQSFNSDGIIKAYAIEQLDKKCLIELEDFNATSIDKTNLIHQLTINEKIILFKKIIIALQQIHNNAIIHKDINPSNIVICQKTLKVKIIDFGISSQFASIEHEHLNSHESPFQGTIPYIAPEQTGRMNRDISFASDLYSLGVTFYEIATGQKPLQASNDQKTIYAHLTESPTPPMEVNNSIPYSLNCIILKLMAKEPSQRYKSCQGLLYDLNLTTHAAPFYVAQNDPTNGINSVNTLVGRENETKLIKNSFQIASEGSLITISGESGVGKTSLIKEAFHEMSLSESNLFHCKFDQNIHSLNFRLFLQQFHKILTNLLDNQNNYWQKKINKELYDELPILSNHLPNIGKLTSTNTSPIELSPFIENSKVQLSFKKLLHFFCNSGQPLILFIDDLHWADYTSTSILSSFIEDSPKNCTIIVTYRPEVAKENQNFSRFKDALDPYLHQANHIQLKPLSSSQHQELLEELLYNEPIQKGIELNAKTYIETEGNPYKLSQTISTYYQKKWLVKNKDTWHWNNKAIDHSISNMRNNKAIHNRFISLDVSTKKILSIGSLLGNIFSIVLVSNILETDSTYIWKQMIPLVHEKILNPSKEILIENHGSKQTIFELVSFSHDATQEAALKNNDIKNWESIYLKIAQELIKEFKNKKENNSLALASHFINLIPTTSLTTNQITTFYPYLIKASEFSKNSADYINTIKLTKLAITISEKINNNDKISEEKELLLERLFFALQATGQFTETSRLIHQLNNDHLSKTFQLKCIKILIYQNAITGDSTSIMKDLRKCFDLLELNFPKQENLKAKTENLITEISLKITKDFLSDYPKKSQQITPEQQLTIQIIRDTGLGFCSHDYQTNAYLFILGFKLCLQWGYTKEASHLATTFACITWPEKGNIDEIKNLSEFALNTCKQHKNAWEYGCSATMIIAYSGIFFKPFKELLAIGRTAIQKSFISGNYIYAGYASAINVLISYLNGDKITELRNVSEKTLMQKENNENIVSKYCCKITNDYTYFLNNSVIKEDIFNIGKCEASEFQTYLLQNQAVFPWGYLLVLRCELNYLLGFPKASLSLVSELLTSGFHIFCTQEELKFYQILSLIHFYIESKSNEKLNEITELMSIHTYKTRYCPENFLAKELLLQAEFERATASSFKTIQKYHDAVNKAFEFNQIKYAALAYEKLAEFLILQNVSTMATETLYKALNAWQNWGAIAKVNQLKDKYSHLLNRTQPCILPQEKDTKTTSLNIELKSILQSLQRISEAREFEYVTSNIMSTLIELSGATEAIMLDSKNQCCLIATKHTIEGKTNVVDIKTQDIPIIETNSTYLQLLKEINKFNSTINYNTIEDIPQATQAELTQLPNSFSIHGFAIKNNHEMLGKIILVNSNMTHFFSQNILYQIKLLSKQFLIAYENAIYSNKLKNHTLELEEEVSKRTEELSREKKIAEIANHNKTSFLAEMSHEIRTPMNAIIGLSSMRSLEGPQQLTLGINKLNMIHKNSKKLLHLINSILDISKVEAGKFEPNYQLIKTKQLFEYLGDLTALQTFDKDIDIVFTIQPTLPKSIIGDQFRIEQILLNIISNAIKFTHQGHIRLDAYSLQGKQIRFTISDTGIGIKKQNLDAIFKPFEQVTDSSNIAGKSSGLGLHISKKIIKHLKGSISVTSEYGKGTTFTIDIPVQIDHEASLREKASIIKHKIQFLPEASFHNKHIKKIIEELAISTHSSLGVIAIIDFDIFEKFEIKAPLQYQKIIIITKNENLTHIENLTHNNVIILHKPFYQFSLIDILCNQTVKKIKAKESTSWHKQSFKGKSILLIDDDPFNKMVLEEMLSDTGITLTSTHNGHEGLNLLENNNYDILMLDIEMPIMSGWQILKKLDANKLRTPPIIVSSARDITINQNYPNLKTSTLLKPYNPEGLYKALAECWQINIDKTSNHSANIKDSRIQLKALTSLNINNGLMYAKDNTKFYIKLLGCFNKSYQNISKEITELSNKEHNKIERKLHTLKSNAGQIGADNIVKNIEIYQKSPTKDNVNLVITSTQLCCKQINSLEYEK